MSNRQNDPPQSLDWTAFRSARIFSINGTWYFATREGFDEGPFERREDVEAAMSDYVEGRQSRWYGLDTG